MKRRSGFTIVELLVSLALIVLIMAVMSEAFVAGLDSVGHLKATGDMQERLRVGAAPMRRDLLARHFDNDEKVSAIYLRPLDPDPQIGQRPTEGFFRIVQNGTFTPEGVDGDNIASFRSGGCELHLTVNNRIRAAGRRDDYFTARVPPGSPAQTTSPIAYQQPGIALGGTAEVRYFLRPVLGETAGNSPTGLQLYTLHRRQKVIHGNALNLNALPANVHGPYTSYGEMACRPNGTNPRFMTLRDLATPANRTLTGLDATGFTGDNTGVGDDLVMTDVLSFTIEVLQVDNPFNFRPISEFCPNVPGNTNAWFYDTGDPAMYDIITGAFLQQYRLRAIKLTLRVWDFKKQMSRQITVIEEL